MKYGKGSHNQRNLRKTSILYNIRIIRLSWNQNHSSRWDKWFITEIFCTENYFKDLVKHKNTWEKVFFEWTNIVDAVIVYYLPKIVFWAKKFLCFQEFE